MFTITVDVMREVLELSLRGRPNDAQVADLTEQLRFALLTLPLSRAGAYRVRIKTRPSNAELTRLAESICKIHDLEPDFCQAS
jgi:hypothetical protein